MILRIIAIFFIFGLVGITMASAQNIIGISPGSHTFKDVLRGGYAERHFTISISTDDPVEVSVEPLGEIKGWINFSDNSSLVSRENPWRLTVSVEPPSDLPNGNYTGFFRVTTRSIGGGGQQGHASGNIRAVLDVALNLEITDIELIACNAKGFAVNSAEKGEEIGFSMDVTNTGNVRLRPTVVVDLWDQDQISIVKTFEFKGEEILPTRESTLNFEAPTDDLEIDQYWANIQVLECSAVSETLTLDVYEPGALRSQGDLREITAPVWADLGETVQILAVFENTGEKSVSAQFRGRILLNERIVQVLESETLDVGISEENNFTFFFTPRDEGRYIVSGRVFYDKKRTFEASRVINVRGTEIGILTILTYLLYAIVIAGFLYLFYRIRRERIRRRSLGLR